MASEEPRFAELVDWVEGRLEPGRAAELAAEVEGSEPDSELRRTVAWLRDVHEHLVEAPLEKPPAVVRQSLNQHFRRWASGVPEPGAPPVHVARLVFDSSVDGRLAATRSGFSPDGPRHLRFASERADLMVDVWLQDDGLTRVEGQVLSHDVAAATVFEARLRLPDGQLRSSDGDQYGRFALPPCTAGPARLEVDNGEFRLLAELDIGAAS